jgi:hypothetical protein
MSSERDRGSADYSSGRNTNAAEAYRLDRARSYSSPSSGYTPSAFSWSSGGSRRANSSSAGSTSSGTKTLGLLALLVALVALVFGAFTAPKSPSTGAPPSK